MRLVELKKGEVAEIVAIHGPIPGHPDVPADLAERLQEVGFELGLSVELLEEGPVGRDPMAVMLDGMIVAIRRVEAESVEISLKGTV